jgi:hypothetical protein
MAVLEACTVIKTRLQPYREANPAGSQTKPCYMIGIILKEMKNVFVIRP